MVLPETSRGSRPRLGEAGTKESKPAAARGADRSYQAAGGRAWSRSSRIARSLDMDTWVLEGAWAASSTTWLHKCAEGILATNCFIQRGLCSMTWAGFLTSYCMFLCWEDVGEYPVFHGVWSPSCSSNQLVVELNVRPDGDFHFGLQGAQGPWMCRKSRPAKGFISLWRPSRFFSVMKK